MSTNDPLRVLLDASVPVSVGRVFEEHKHIVIYYHEVLADAAPDPVVCAAAIANDAILIAVDGDMKRLAKRYGMAPTNARFERLNLIQIGCNGVTAAKRIDQAMSPIEHEWAFSEKKAARRLWVDVTPHYIRTHR